MARGAAVVRSQGTRLEPGQAKEHGHERVVAWLLNVMGDEETAADVAAGCESPGADSCASGEGVQEAGEAERGDQLAGEAASEDVCATTPVAGSGDDAVHQDCPTGELPSLGSATDTSEDDGMPSPPAPAPISAAPASSYHLALPLSPPLSPSHPTLLSVLSELCHLWSSLHTDLRVRSSTFLSLMPPAVTVHDCSSASLGLLPAPPAMVKEVERLRVCVGERSEEGGGAEGGKRELEQRLAVLVHARERLGSEEREELYEEWGVGRLKASRLRRVVLVKMWNDPTR